MAAKTPDHELKQAAEALKRGENAPDNVREVMDGILTQRAVTGLIRSRTDLLEHVHDLGCEVTRAGKDYITVAAAGQRWRLKGPLYARDFDPGRAITAADAARERALTPASRTLEHASDALARAAPALEHLLEQEQTLERHRGRNRGWELGR
jgi:hypothetical protein